MTLKHLAHAAYHTLAISAATLLDAARGKPDPNKQDARLIGWAKRVLAYAEVQLEVVFESEIAPDEAFVVMSNHQSLYDIPAVYAALQRRIRMVAKKELFAIPVWGAAMRSAGMVELDRKNRRSALASLDQAEAALLHGTSIWIAPEGTRSTDGRLGAFKKGGFRVALAAGVRILPVTIDGTRNVLSAHSRSVRSKQRVRVVIHSPVATQGLTEADVPNLIEQVQSRIASALAEQ